MKDAVDSVIAERERLDRGFPAGLVMSLAGHLLIAGAAFALPILLPAKPKLQVSMGIVIPVPRGGGGSPQAGPPDGGAAQQPPVTQAPEPEPPKPEPVKVVKPPKEAERKGLPDPKADKKKSKAKKPEPVRASNSNAAKSASSKKPAGSGAQTSTPSSATPGVGIGPVGPGLPGGSGTGDWYLASVQQKIWMVWNQQIRTGTYPPVTVRFTILGDGKVIDVAVVQSSGQYMLDQAAQRAVLTAAPFTALPRSYDTKAFTLQAVFQPVG